MTEDLERSNADLKSANEELMSMNEELQSSNEELETSKQELQSVNEELATVNAELASKLRLLGETNADLQNLLESTRIATIFLDRALRLRRFTPVAGTLFRLVDGDIGRPVAEIASIASEIDLAPLATGVLADLRTVEREIDLPGGLHMMMRALPYRGNEDRIDGVVLTFVDISEIKAHQTRIGELNADLTARVAELQALLDLVPIGIAISADPDMREIRLNRHAQMILHLPETTPPPGDPRIPYRFELDGEPVPAENLPIRQVWRTGKPVRDFHATWVLDRGERFDILSSAAPLLDASCRVSRVIAAFEDITRVVSAQAAAERRAAQQELIARLGDGSLRGESLATLIAKLPARLAELTGADCAKVLRFERASGDFSLVSETGFDTPPGTLVPGGDDSQAGHTVKSSAPIVVEDLRREQRFRGPALLRDAGVVSGMSVTIGEPGAPWGVLGVHARRPNAFSTRDVQFLQATANVIAAAMQRDEWLSHQKLLVDELRHRVKNALAVVQAVARMTLLPGPCDRAAVEGFLHRLQALSAAHEVQFAADGRDVEFRRLVETQVAALFEDEDVLRLDGPDGVQVTPAIATDLALVFHELATNALKHGAPSAGGEVRLGWRTETAGQEVWLRVTWAERGGPPLAPPQKTGSGSNLMERLLRQDRLRGEWRFDPEGLTATILIRLM